MGGRLAGLALFVARFDPERGWTVASTGGSLVGDGLLLIGLRSRLPVEQSSVSANAR